ncbi:MAG: hypothetical protein QOF60_2784 [Actinomycetota bacterium]|nr:hypothetical protein [Actinomycetota bacterium]
MTRIGLVLGAGGATGGAFHGGVLAALADVVGWDARSAEIIVGTSAGSLAGAVLRAGLSPSDLAARSEDRPLSVDGQRLLAHVVQALPLRPASGRRFPGGRSAAPAAVARMVRRPWTMSPGALAAALLPAGSIPTDMITEGIGPMFGSAWPSSPLWICTVRLDDGRRVVFGKDDTTSPIGLAVAASCAIPAFFEPVTIGSARYVDGGVHSPTNLDLLRGLGLDLVVVSSPMSIAGRPSLFPGSAAIATPVRRACRAMLDREAIGVRRRGTPVIAFQPTAADVAVMGVNAMDASRRAEVSRQVRASTARRLERPDVRARLAALAG